MSKPTLLILAAGMGSRYGGLKQLDTVGPSGETIIDYSVYDAISAGFGKVVFVIRKAIEEDFKEIFSNRFNDSIQVEYVLQELEMIPKGVEFNPKRQKPWGTGHAILVAKEKINEPFVAINADDFYGSEAFKLIAKYLQNHRKEGDFAMVGYRLKNTLSKHGTVSRGVCQSDTNDKLLDVIECTKIEEKRDSIVFIDQDSQEKNLDPDSTVSMNFWGFQPSLFQTLEDEFRVFMQKNKDQLKAEFYIPFVVNQMIQNKRASVQVLTNPAKWIGVTYRDDKEDVISHIKDLIDKKEYPNDLWKK